MPKLLVRNEQKLMKLPVRALKSMAVRVSDDLALPDGEISVLLCDDAHIAELNRRFMNRDGATNVLSFLYRSPGDPVSPDTGLGDVAISVETCARNARKARIDPVEEVAFCLIHGLCHLAGHDHVGVPPARRREMQTLEKRLMKDFGGIAVRRDV